MYLKIAPRFGISKNEIEKQRLLNIDMKMKDNINIKPILWIVLINFLVD